MTDGWVDVQAEMLHDCYTVNQIIVMLMLTLAVQDDRIHMLFQRQRHPAVD